MTELRGNRLGLEINPQEILALLEMVADKYGFNTPHQRSYYIWDRTTIRQINWFSTGSLKRLLGTYIRDSFPRIYKSNCGADYLRVRNNYLGFYLGRDSVIKIFLDIDAFQGHVDGVSRFNDFGFKSIKAPQIIESGLDPMPHIVESFLPGNNYQVIPLDLQESVIKELARFHLDRMELIDIELMRTEREQIVAGLKSIGLDQDQTKLIQELLSKSTMKVLEGEIHGDLNRGNLIRGSDADYLTDWEFFSRGPIAQDLVKLYFQGDRDLREKILNLYNKKLRGLSDLDHYESFHSQMLFYTLRLLPTIETSTAEQFHRVFSDNELVEHKISIFEKNLISAIKSLLEY